MELRLTCFVDMRKGGLLEGSHGKPCVPQQREQLKHVFGLSPGKSLFTLVGPQGGHMHEVVHGNKVTRNFDRALSITNLVSVGENMKGRLGHGAIPDEGTQRE